MKKHHILPILCCWLLSVDSASATEEFDAVSVSPDQFEVILENEHVRVVRYRLDPGEKDSWHTHPAKVSVVVAGGTLLITTADGEEIEVVEEAGSASWMARLGRHFATNIGSSPVHIILIEVKSAGEASI